MLQEHYSAVDFIPCLQAFLQQHFRGCKIQPREGDLFDVYKRLKLQYKSLQGFGEPPEQDTIRATPFQPAPRAGRPHTPAYFDTALVDREEGTAELTGVQGIFAFLSHK